MVKDKSKKGKGGPPKIIELSVSPSPIRTDGSCRVHDSVLDKIDVDEKAQVAIYFDGAIILSTIFADELMEEDKIKIRSKSQEIIGAMEGDRVVVGSQGEMKEYVKSQATKKKGVRRWLA